jgi:hypothetical protein
MKMAQVRLAFIPSKSGFSKICQVCAAQSATEAAGE